MLCNPAERRVSIMKKLLTIGVLCVVLVLGSGNVFAAKYLVYDPGGSQDSIQGAMTTLGFSYDVRNAGSAVTAADLATGGYEALVIGWSVGGDYSGLSPSILATGITGNRIFTGHDADFHTQAGVAAAATFMQRAVLFAGAASGTGILGFPQWDSSPFGYLPSAWVSSATGLLEEETIQSITADGVASGLYAGLSLAVLSNWGQSYHAVFNTYDPIFKSFEIGSFNDGSTVTIGTTVEPLVTPEPATLLLVGLGLLGLAGLRRK
jgi:hypothetical protein